MWVELKFMVLRRREERGPRRGWRERSEVVIVSNR